MRNIEEVKEKLSMMIHARHEQPPEIQVNYDTVISILRWVLADDYGMAAHLRGSGLDTKGEKV